MEPTCAKLVEELQPCYFLTPPWITTWLSIFGAQLQAELLVFRDPVDSDHAAVGMCLLTRRVEREAGFRVKRVYLNTAGENEEDETLIEHNTIICRKGCERRVVAALRVHLNEEGWEEFVAPAMAPGPVLAALFTDAFPGVTTKVSAIPSPYVDLSVLQSGRDAYLEALSRNTREQIRRSRRIYAKQGPIEVHVAASTTEALAMLEQLAILHQRSWTARGRPGVFSSERFRTFHRALIGRFFDAGGITLMRVQAGQDVIGLLYGFVRHGRFHFYQSGLSGSADRRIKPGLVAHAAAIEHCRERGMKEYDFLAGDSQYKRSLANATRDLTWAVFRRSCLRLRLISSLRLFGSKRTGVESTRSNRQGSAAPNHYSLTFQK